MGLLDGFRSLKTWAAVIGVSSAFGLLPVSAGGVEGGVLLERARWALDDDDAEPDEATLKPDEAALCWAR